MAVEVRDVRDTCHLKDEDFKTLQRFRQERGTPVGSCESVSFPGLGRGTVSKEVAH